jgi:hypothetical protein
MIRTKANSPTIETAVLLMLEFDARRLNDDRLLYWVSECERVGATQSKFGISLLAELDRRTQPSPAPKGE